MSDVQHCSRSCNKCGNRTDIEYTNELYKLTFLSSFTKFLYIVPHKRLFQL